MQYFENDALDLDGPKSQFLANGKVAGAGPVGSSIWARSSTEERPLETKSPVSFRVSSFLMQLRPLEAANLFFVRRDKRHSCLSCRLRFPDQE